MSALGFPLPNPHGVTPSAAAGFSDADRRVLHFARRCAKAGHSFRAAVLFAWDLYDETGELPRSDEEYAADLAAEFAAPFEVVFVAHAPVASAPVARAA